MPDDKTLSPTEWKSATDYVVELSQRVVEASSASKNETSQDRKKCNAVSHASAAMTD